MRLALFSDLHANLAAFEACLEDAKRQGFDRAIILGDLVGYGPSPVEVVQLCMQMQSDGAIVLRGNHDEVAPASADRLTAGNAQAIAADWTFGQLDGPAQKWLWQLPLFHVIDDIVFVHATMDDPQAWHYANEHLRVLRSLDAALETTQAKIVLCGHVHQQSLFYQGGGREFMSFTPTPGVPIRVGAHRRWLATVGSVGQPRDGDPRASYAIMDMKNRHIVFYRVAYEIEQTVRGILDQGLPRELAIRLETGR